MAVDPFSLARRAAGALRQPMTPGTGVQRIPLPRQPRRVSVHKGGMPLKHDHALSKGAATHLLKMGHISNEQHDHIVKTSNHGIKRAPARFGSLGAGHYLSTPTPTGDDEGGY